MEKQLRILMLEDNPEDAELVEFELQEAGFDYALRKVIKEEEFLHALREFTPDVILSDYDLPTYSGALAMAAAKAVCPDVPFILVTGAISEDRAIDALTSGAKDYVMKTRLHRLVPAVNRALAEAAEHKARKKAEADLRAALRYSRNLLESSLDPLVTISSAGKVTDVNKATEAATGINRNEIIGTDFVDYFTDPEKAEVGYQRVFRDGSVRDYPLVMRHTSGSTIDVLYNASIYRNEKGEVQGVFAAARDITEPKKAERELREAKTDLEYKVEERTAQLRRELAERKQAEEALKESEKLFRSVVENTSAIILRVNPKGVITFANAQALKFFGYSAEELIGQHAVGKIVPVRDSDGRNLATMIDEISADPDRFRTNANENICKDGRRVWLEWTNSGIYDAAGNLQESLAVGIDATERKQTEAALQQSEDKFRKITESSQVQISVTRLTDGTILFTNKAFDEAYGYSAGELIGTQSAIFYNESGDREKLIEYLKRKGSLHNYEVSVKKKDGTPFWTSVSLSIITYQGDEAILNTAIDITERKQSEKVIQDIQKQRIADLETLTWLQRIGTLYIYEGNLETVLSEIVEAAIAISGADFGNIQLLDRKTSTLKIVAQRGLPQWWLDYWNSVSEGRGSCGTALKKAERVIVEDVEKSPIFAGTDALTIQLRAGIRAVQSTPLTSRSGNPLGMFSTHYKKPCRPDDNALRHLDLLSRHAADIIERAQAESRIAADLAALQRMHGLSGRLLEEGGTQALLQEVMDAAVEIMGAKYGTLQLLEDNTLRIVAHHGHQPPFLEFFASAENRASACGAAMTSGSRVIVQDIEKSELFEGTSSLTVLRQAGVRAIQSTPLISRSGEMLGILTTQWSTPSIPDDQDFWRLDLLARQASDLIEYVRKEKTQPLQYAWCVKNLQSGNSF